MTIVRPNVCDQGTKEDVRRLHCEMELPHSIHSLYITISYSFCLKWFARLFVTYHLTIQVNEYFLDLSLIFVRGQQLRWFTWALCPACIYYQKKKGCMEVSNTPKYNRFSKHYAWYNFTEETLTLISLTTSSLQLYISILVKLICTCTHLRAHTNRVHFAVTSSCSKYSENKSCTWTDRPFLEKRILL